MYYIQNKSTKPKSVFWSFISLLFVFWHFLSASTSAFEFLGFFSHLMDFSDLVDQFDKFRWVQINL